MTGTYRNQPDETFREAMDRIARQVESLSPLPRWVMRRRMAKLRRKVSRERDVRLRRWWRDPR